MNLIKGALRKPLTVIIAVLAIAYFFFFSVKKIKVDIFPQIESPSIYVIMPYSGLYPRDMDAFMSVSMQGLFLFVNGVKNLEFRNIQGITMVRFDFYPGTDMSEVTGQIANYVNRAMGSMPAGAVPPMMVRFDATSLPVGELVFESPNRSVTEIQNLVQTEVRPLFVNIPGITAPAAFGGNVRTIVIQPNLQYLQSHNLSPEDIVTALAKNNLPSPAGNLRVGNKNYMTPLNSMASTMQDFENIPIKTINNQTVYVKDIGKVVDGADITQGYASVNGHRSVYLPIIKKADASTLTAVNNLKSSMEMLRNALPKDVTLDFVFDQTEYISNSLNNLIHEGILGAILTGLMVLMFLGDRRGALVVVMTIPISILSAVIVLHIFGQTINTMTLSGLALAIGILVDEATVSIENIHQHFEMGKTKSRAIYDALEEVSIPKLLILLCILAVLVPSFMMEGIPRDMFLPLSLAVGFSMIFSFIASQTFVPVMANYIMRKSKKHEQHNENHPPKGFNKFKLRYLHFLERMQTKRVALLIGYSVIIVGLVALFFARIGMDIMPPTDNKDFQLRIAGQPGDRLELSEENTRKILNIIQDKLGKDAINVSSSYTGMQASSYPINYVFNWSSNSAETVLQVQVDNKKIKMPVAQMRETLRKEFEAQLPQVKITFEPMELMTKVMYQGATTPIQIKVAANQPKASAATAQKIIDKLKQSPNLRDVHLLEEMNYPILRINADRTKAAQFDVTMQDIANAVTAATSSTRFGNRNLWVDPKSGLSFQTQVQLPEASMNDVSKLENLPIKKGAARPVLSDVATIEEGAAPAQVNRQGPNRYVTIIANFEHTDLGSASKEVDKALKSLGTPPRGTIITKEGSLPLLDQTLSGLQTGLGVAIVVILLLLAAYYQSFSISLLILSVVPSVIAGSLAFLLLAGSSLNLQSYMGMIMSIGVSVSNSVLMINQAEVYRKRDHMSIENAAIKAADSRLRPILMTAIAMLAGMLPMALGLGDGGSQVAPLGQAVMGGLIFSTLTSLLFLPFIYQLFRSKKSLGSNSLDPDDPQSRFASTI